MSCWHPVAEPLKDQVQLHLKAAPQVVELFRAVKLEVQSSLTGNVSAYLDFLKKIDIGVANASRNDFSSGRSDGTFIEYASRCVIAVCSDGPPDAGSIDSGETGFLFGNEAELLNSLLKNCRCGSSFSSQNG
jgi:hypothetical protein